MIDDPSIQWYLYRKYQIYIHRMVWNKVAIYVVFWACMWWFEKTKITKMHFVHNYNEMKVHFIIPCIPFRNNSTCDCSEFLAVSVLTSVWEVIGQQQNSNRHDMWRRHDMNNSYFLQLRNLIISNFICLRRRPTNLKITKTPYLSWLLSWLSSDFFVYHILVK